MFEQPKALNPNPSNMISVPEKDEKQEEEKLQPSDSNSNIRRVFAHDLPSSACSMMDSSD